VAPLPRVLVLLSYQPQLPWTRALVAGLLDEAGAAAGSAQVDLQMLEQDRQPTPAVDADRARLITGRYRDQLPDVVVVESLPALRFYDTHLRGALAGVPLVVLKEGPDDLAGLPVAPATELTIATQFGRTVELAVGLHHPTRAYLIGDANPESQTNLQSLQTLLAAAYPALQVERLDALDPARLQQRLQEELPAGERAVAFYALVFHDAQGRPAAPAAVLQGLAQGSRFPVYSFWDTMVGRGAVGGHVTSAASVGRQLLREALDRVRPQPASGPPAARKLAALTTLAFDARELARWQIAESSLPAGAEIRHRQPSLWRDYRVEILAAAALLTLQALLIALLARTVRGRRLALRDLALERAGLERRVQARTADLQSAELRYRTVADHTYDWGTWNDPFGRWLYCSPACVRISGHARGEFMAQPGLFTGLVHPEDRTRVQEHMAATCCSDGPFGELDFRIQRPDGREVWIAHACQAVYDDQGVFLGHRASNRDVTSRKLAEIRLRASEADLRQAKEVAEAASRARATFLAQMSHELRTPMNGIMGFTAMALRKCEDPAVTRLLEQAQGSSRQLFAVISDLLDITALESDRLTLERRRFILGEVVGRVAEAGSLMAGDKGLHFQLDLAPGLAAQSLEGDPARLEQVLANLVDNAVRFTEQGFVALHVRQLDAGPGLEHQLLLRAEVQDSGIGIPAHAQPGLFVAFRQVDDSLTRRYGGTGLGLAISRRLVSLMGGRIGVDSTPRSGSCFWFTARFDRAGGDPAVLPPPASESCSETLTRSGD
jgi:PAS domain S-box-containing protein